MLLRAQSRCLLIFEHMEWLIEIIKIAIPLGLLVVLAYVLLNQVFTNQMKVKAMEIQREKKKDTLQFKLNAYERLALYLERISFPDIVMRTSSTEMDAHTLYTALLLTVQKEFEHNLTQQVYISENLWQIIYLAKQELANLITEAYHENPNQSREVYVRLLMSKYASWSPNPIEKAKSAIRQEASLLL